MQRPGNLNGASSWFGELNGRGRGRGMGRRRGKGHAKGHAMGRRRRPGFKKGMGMKMKAMAAEGPAMDAGPIEPKLVPPPPRPRRCGWWCRLRRRWMIGKPPSLPPAPISVDQSEPSAEDIIEEASGVDPTVNGYLNGYFGDWSYF